MDPYECRGVNVAVAEINEDTLILERGGSTQKKAAKKEMHWLSICSQLPLMALPSWGFLTTLEKNLLRSTRGQRRHGSRGRAARDEPTQQEGSGSACCASGQVAKAETGIEGPKYEAAASTGEAATGAVPAAGAVVPVPPDAPPSASPPGPVLPLGLGDPDLPVQGVNFGGRFAWEKYILDNVANDAGERKVVQLYGPCKIKIKNKLVYGKLQEATNEMFQAWKESDPAFSGMEAGHNSCDADLASLGFALTFLQAKNGGKLPAEQITEDTDKAWDSTNPDNEPDLTFFPKYTQKLLVGSKKLPKQVSHEAQAEAGKRYRRMLHFHAFTEAPRVFKDMREKKVNTVRISLGYWNLLDLGKATPNGPEFQNAVPVTPRWRSLQNLGTSKFYKKVIAQIFLEAKKHGLKLLLDFHGAPGGQTANHNVGTDLGGGNGNTFFFKAAEELKWNTHLGIQSLTNLAKICEEHKHNCAGVELLNEPSGTIDTTALLNNFYKPAIKEIRKTLDVKIPVVIMDWTAHRNFWRNTAQPGKEELKMYKTANVVFSTHLYNFGLNPQNFNELKRGWSNEFLTYAWWQGELKKQGIDLFITEFGLNAQDQSKSHQQFLEAMQLLTSMNGGKGSMVWNYDGGGWWGPMKNGKSLNWEKVWKQGIEGSKLRDAGEIWNKVR